MMTLSTIDLAQVSGGRLARRSPRIDAPEDFLPVGLTPEQITNEQSKLDLHARVNISILIRDVRPWLTPQQSRDPKLVEEFMRLGF